MVAVIRVLTRGRGYSSRNALSWEKVVTIRVMSRSRGRRLS